MPESKHKQVNTGRMPKFAAALRAGVEGIAAPKGQIYNLRDVEEHDAPHIRHRFCRIRIITQYTGGKPLKEPRVITSSFAVEAL